MDWPTHLPVLKNKCKERVPTAWDKPKLKLLCNTFLYFINVLDMAMKGFAESNNTGTSLRYNFFSLYF